MSEQNDPAGGVEDAQALGSIAPKPPELSRHRKTTYPQRRRWWIRFAAQSLALGIIVCLTVIVLVNVGQDNSSSGPGSAPDDGPGPVAAPREDSELPEPFRDLQLERAQETARERLRELGALQSIIEKSYNGGSWDNGRLEAILSAASDGDVLFANREFEAALDRYEEATDSLRSFINEAREIIAVQSEVAIAALNSREEEAAREALDAIESIQPKRRETEMLLARLESLPEVRRLQREAARAELRGAYENARDLLLQARSLDPLSDDIDARILETEERILQERLRKSLSGAFSALQGGEYDAAETAFIALLDEFPENGTALKGLDDARQRRTSDAVAALREMADAAERSDKPVEAIAHFEEALKIDRSLRFAREGAARLRQVRSALLVADRITEDPHLLSSESELEATQVALHSKREGDFLGGGYAGRRWS